MKKTKTGSWISSNWKLIVGAVVVIFFILVLLGSNKSQTYICSDSREVADKSLCSSGVIQSSVTNPSDIQVTSSTPQNTQPTCRTVEYTDTEYYTEQECQYVPYTDQECEAKALSYSRTNITCKTGGLIGDWLTSSCTINNLDSEAGTFVVGVGITLNGNQVGEQQTAYIYPQTAHNFKYDVQASGSSCYCSEVNVPTKQVCRDVIKSRQECSTVTKSRPVTKTRQQCD